MPLDECGKFLKYSLFLINFLIFLGGLTIVGLGVWTLVDSAKVQSLLDSNTYKASPYILLVFGGIVAFISFLGCCGAIKEVKCLLVSFFVVLLLITIVIIVGVALTFTSKDQLEKNFRQYLKDSMSKYYNDQSVKDSWDNTQRALKCCGIDGPLDWDSYLPSPPDSCKCTDKDLDLHYCIAFRTGNFWKKGCQPAIKDVILNHSTTLQVAGIIIIVIIVLAMIFSCTLSMKVE